MPAQKSPLPSSRRPLPRSRRGAPGTLRRTLYEWVSQLIDPNLLLAAIRGFPPYIRAFRRYRQAGGSVRWRDTIPRLRDATGVTPFDAHYFYMVAWAMKRITQLNPDRHVEVAGPVAFAASLAACVPTFFLDYRPLGVRVEGLTVLGGDLLALPFRDRSVESLSCLHVAEHVGLGRYGDPLDTAGTSKACGELSRVLAPGGTLLFALPVGLETIHFNAHRILPVEEVIHLFAELNLVDFSLVDDEGVFLNNISPEDAGSLQYGCGMFTFRRE